MAFYGPEEMGISADRLSTHLIVAAWEWGHIYGTRSN